MSKCPCHAHRLARGELDDRTDWSVWNVAEQFTYPLSNTGTETTLLVMSWIMTLTSWEEENV